MRFSATLPIAAAFALAACGSEAPAENAEAMSMDEVADQIADGPTPEPGEYSATIELLEFDIPGADNAIAEMIRSSFEAASQQASNSCITAEQAATSREDMIKNMGEGDCSVTKMEMSGGTIDAALSCAADGNVAADVTLVGEMTSQGADMVVTSVVPVPGMGEANVRMRIKTERIGDCS